MLLSDYLTKSGREESGGLLGAYGVDICSFVDGGAQEYGKRAGTENVAAITAMAVALRKNCDRMKSVERKLRKLEMILLDGLTSSGIFYMRNGSCNHLPGNVNISIRNADGEMLLHRLDLKGICISTGSACDSVNTRVSHVIEAIHVPDEYAKGMIRISFGAENTEDDAAAIARELISIIKR